MGFFQALVISFNYFRLMVSEKMGFISWGYCYITPLKTPKTVVFSLNRLKTHMGALSKALSLKREIVSKD